MTDYNKLVRDKIPEIIIAEGTTPYFRAISGDELLSAVLAKLIEEAKEPKENPSLEERADVQEILRLLDNLLGYNAQQIDHEANKKRQIKGGFDLGIFLERTE